MALVLLPCDLPSWVGVQRQLNHIRNAQNSAQLVDAMQKLHDMCCISLDPDENDRSDPKTFTELQNFLDYVYTNEERNIFFHTILPSIVTYALRLKQYKPYDGLRYSLQQQVDCTELDRRFVASLVANAFFSTFPRRTKKTHPTLQDCNFSKYFIHLKSTFQQSKLRSVLSYFEFIAVNEPKGKIILARQVIPKKVLFSMDDWLSCDRPLCPVIIRYDGKIEQPECGIFQICFSSDKIGGALLEGGDRQEDLMFCAFPELFMTLLTTEALENNEAFIVHGLFPIAYIESHPEESLEPKILTVNNHHGLLNTHVCFIDATDFHSCPSAQYEESNILRELNKAFIGFHQQQQPPYIRLPPIGKSCSSTPPENARSGCNNNEALKAPCLPGLTEVCEATMLRQNPADPISLSLMKDLMKQKGGLCDFVNKMLWQSDAVQTNVGPLSNSKGVMEAIKKVDNPESQCKTTICGQCRFPLSENSETTLNRVSKVVRNGDTQDCGTIELREPKMLQFVNNRTSETAVKFLPGHFQPFVREESEDSVYSDCKECLEVCEPTESNSMSLQRPLKLSRHRPVLVESMANHLPGSAHSTVTKNNNLQVPDPLPLEGTSMEASFVSCHSQISSSSSEEEGERNTLEDDDDEEGFVSCAEDWEEAKDERKIKASRQTLQGIPESPLDSENLWGHRNILADLAAGKNRLSNSSDVEMDDNNSLTLDIHIGGPYLEDREEFVLRRSASTGFMLDEDDDLFIGDGLEHEREWLAQFRHRSTNPSRSISRRNSSRYSFSSDFSSDLEDIYEHFEEKMTEGPIRENPVYTSRLGGRLKRALSDSLTTFPTVSHGFPRSLSLTEKLQQEKLCLEYAKKSVQESPVHETVENESCDCSHSSSAEIDEDPDSGKLKASQLPGQLVGTCLAVEQHLSEIEECVTLPLPGTHLFRDHLPRLPSQPSVWWNYNAVYDFCVPLNQFPNARKYRFRDEDGESKFECSLTVVPHSLQQQAQYTSNLDVITESPDGSSDGPDSAPSLLITEVGYPHQENKANAKELGGGYLYTKDEEDTCSNRMNDLPLGICRSKSASTTYEMAKKHLEEQQKFTVPWVLQDSSSVGSIMRSVSLTDVKALLNQGFASVGDQNFTIVKDKSDKIVLKHQQQSCLKKWQAACNLNSLEALETLRVGDQALLVLQESRQSEKDFAQVPVFDSQKTSVMGCDKSLVSNHYGKCCDILEDLTNGQLDNHISLGEPTRLVSDSNQFLLKNQHNPEMFDNFSKIASSKSSQNSYWTKCNLSDHLSSVEIQRSSDQLLELVLDGEGIKPIATGNWGCGQQGGDPQLKALIQWMAASRANIPFMVYYTGGDQRIVKLNIVCRVLMDRHWSVSHIARAVLQHYGTVAKAKSLHPGDNDLLDSLLPKETDL